MILIVIKQFDDEVDFNGQLELTYAQLSYWERSRATIGLTTSTPAAPSTDKKPSSVRHKNIS